MHILIITNYYPTNKDAKYGLWPNHVKGLKDRGIKVGVVAPIKNFRKNSKLYLFPTFQREDNVQIIRWAAWDWFEKFRKIGIRQRIIVSSFLIWVYIIKNGLPDIIHAHNSHYAGLVASYAAQKYNLPFILTEHMSWFAQNRFAPSEFPYIKTVFSNASARIVVSPSLGHTLEQVFGERARPWHYIPNMVDGNFFDIDSNNSFKTNDFFTFFHVSNLSKIKNIECMLYAFAEAFKNTKNVKLKIGGGNSKRIQELRETVYKLGVEDQVNFLGTLLRNEVVQQMQKCDAYVLSSNYETFGIPIIEAWACGKPVLSTICGGPAFLVNKSNGILVKHNDIASLSSGFSKMYKTAHLYNPLALRRECLAIYDKPVVIDRLLEIYNQVLKNQ